jgi:hypothetical protein
MKKYPISRVVVAAATAVAAAVVAFVGFVGSPSPASAAIPSIDSCDHLILKKGNSGGCVKRVQHELGGLARDGDYGTLTTKAVKNFQRSRGMQVDGVVGARMWSRLRNRLPAQGTAIFSAKGVHWFACRNSANTKIQLAVRNGSGKLLNQTKVLSSDGSGYKMGTVQRGELRRTSFYEEGSKRTFTRMTGYFLQSWTVTRTESFLRGRLPVCR